MARRVMKTLFLLLALFLCTGAQNFDAAKLTSVSSIIDSKRLYLRFELIRKILRLCSMI